MLNLVNMKQKQEQVTVAPSPYTAPKASPYVAPNQPPAPVAAKYAEPQTYNTPYTGAYKTGWETSMPLYGIAGSRQSPLQNRTRQTIATRTRSLAPAPVALRPGKVIYTAPARIMEIGRSLAPAPLPMRKGMRIGSLHVHGY